MCALLDSRRHSSKAYTNTYMLYCFNFFIIFFLESHLSVSGHENVTRSQKQKSPTLWFFVSGRFVTSSLRKMYRQKKCSPIISTPFSHLLAVTWRHFPFRRKHYIRKVTVTSLRSFLVVTWFFAVFQLQKTSHYLVKSVCVILYM